MQFDAATRICDDISIKAEFARISDGIGHTVVCGKAGDVDLTNSFVVEKLGKSCLFAMVIIEKGAVAVDVAIGAFVEGLEQLAGVPSWCKFSAVRSLDA